MRQNQVFCLSVGIALLFHQKVFAICEGPGSNEELSCVVDSQSCSVSLTKWNISKDSMCSAISDYRPLPDSNNDNYGVTLVAYEKSFSKHPAIRESGLNVSLTVKRNDTTGFVMWLGIKASNYNLCRYIDITNTRPTGFKRLLTVSYDCMFFHAREIGYPYTLMVRELPSQLQRTLTCRVPDVDHLNPATIADWKSMICVEKFPAMGSVYVWFQSAPQRYGHFNYSVVLYRNDTAERNLTVYTKERFHSEKFSNLSPGTYVVKMRPLHPDCGSKCKTTMSAPFNIEKKGHSPFFLPTYAIIAITAVIPLTLLIAWFICSRIKPSVRGSTLYVAYVYNRESHFQTVKQFATLLQSLNFRVLFDEWEVQGRNPMDWIKDCVNDADFILIVWSEAAIRRNLATETEADKRNEPNYLTSHLFKFILYCIDCRVNDSCNGKNKHSPDSICNICWDTSTKQHIPKSSKSYRTFVIPNKVSRLLHYLHNYSTPRNLPCEVCLPTMPGENLNAYKEGRMFLEALSRYQQELVHSPELNSHDSVFEEAENFSQYPLVNGVQNDAIVDLPNESITDQGYESWRTENTNDSTRTMNRSMPVSGGEPVDVQATNKCVEPYSDEKETERGLEYLRSTGILY